MKKLLFLYLLLPQFLLAQTKELVITTYPISGPPDRTTQVSTGKKISFAVNYSGSLEVVTIFSIPDALVKSQDDPAEDKYIHKVIRKATLPVMLIGFGFAGTGKRPLLEYNEEIEEAIQEHYSGFHTKIDNYTRYAPIAMAYCLNIAGIKGQHSLVNLTCLFVLSDFISSATTKTLKDITHQMRPDHSTADAFPSGHTSGAFTGATILFLEYKDKSIWYGISGYSFAVATGALRMMNNKHWFSDVVTGAGIGILSTQVAYAVYPWIQKQISQGIPKLSNKSLFLSPTYANKALGIGMVYQLK
ncbi:phosphatase PAP2 family protein [Adhaeribacter arboris]|nr:phosphatase PAP2 family protein [Adhaeribacter arboris]